MQERSSEVGISGVRNPPELIAAARTDPQKCSVLVEKNWGLIVRVAHQRLASAQLEGFEFDDLVDIGVDTVLSHSRYYDPARNDSYAHFIAMCMHQAISKAIIHRRSVNWWFKVLPFESPRRSWWEDEEMGNTHGRVLSDTLGYQEQAYDALLEYLSNSQRCEVIAPLLELLDPLERRVLHLYYWGNMTYRAIARDLGCSYEWVRQLRDRAIEKIRSALKERGQWPEE